MQPRSSSLCFTRLKALGLPGIFYEREKPPCFKMNLARGSSEKFL
jgi:hypothetical protein